MDWFSCTQWKWRHKKVKIQSKLRVRKFTRRCYLDWMNANKGCLWNQENIERRHIIELSLKIQYRAHCTYNSNRKESRNDHMREDIKSSFLPLFLSISSPKPVSIHVKICVHYSKLLFMHQCHQSISWNVGCILLHIYLLSEEQKFMQYTHWTISIFWKSIILYIHEYCLTSQSGIIATKTNGLHVN